MIRPSNISHVTKNYDLQYLTERQFKMKQLTEHIEYLSSLETKNTRNMMAVIKYHRDKLEQLNKLK